MEFQKYLLLTLFLVFCFVFCTHSQSHDIPRKYDTVIFNRSCFPQDFLFGIGSSSYQYEGATKTDGKGASIWDTFTHKHPEKMMDRSDGDVAVDQYHRYKEDVALIKNMGVDVYRFSISWPRILPNGKVSGGVNQKGINYYNNLINELLANGIQPFVTLYHWDLPQALEDEYGGFRNPNIVNDFQKYAEICFKNFSDRVKYWTTLNEPLMFSYAGYALGVLAPGRCSDWQKLNCSGGDSGTEPYLVAHYQLLAHAAAVKLYREKYQATQEGIIGIDLVSDWFEPFSRSRKDAEASIRALDFNVGWFMDPLTFGDYPSTMKSLVGERLPRLTDENSRMIKGSFDFIGFHYYTARYAKDIPQAQANTTHPSYLTDSRVDMTTKRNGALIGEEVGASWIRAYPKGIHDLLLYINEKYNSPLIYITENGVDQFDNGTLPLKKALNDIERIGYHHDHLSFIRRAIRDGVNIKGYVIWTLLDDFEWPSGYTSRFGMHYVDFKDGLKRYPKQSVSWLKSFLTKSSSPKSKRDEKKL